MVSSNRLKIPTLQNSTHLIISGMKKLLVLLFLTSALFAVEILTEPLLELLALHGVEHDGSWESIVRETQKQKRECGKELWDLKDDGQDQRRIFELASALEMTQTRLPSKKHYAYGVVLGARRAFLQQRLNFLLAQNITFDELVFLVDVKEEVPSFEWEGKVTVISYKSDQSRATTKDTLQLWAPEKGDALIVSSQPFIGRQGATCLNNLNIDFEIVGPGFTFEDFLHYPAGPAIIWETVIRWIYEVHA